MRKIIVDTYGSDKGEECILRGTAKAMLEDVSFEVILAGNAPLCERIMDEEGITKDRYSVIHTTDYITNNDPPVCVYGGRDDSSMVLAFEKAKADEDCIGMVSAGNTGALLVGSMCRLGLVGGVRQPSLASVLLFMENKYICIADCGGNIDCKAKELVGFAKMGNVLMKSMYSIESPRIALLSVGREDKKGNALTKEAFGLLENTDLNFIGNVEGSDVVGDCADVIVCDGFAGNILLKTIEGVGKYSSKVAAGYVADDENRKTVEREVHEHFDFNSRGGAIFLGTAKPLVKMHGAAEERTVGSCIKLVLALDNGNFTENLKRALED